MVKVSRRSYSEMLRKLKPNHRYAAVYYNRFGAGTVVLSTHRYAFAARAVVDGYRGSQVVPIGEVSPFEDDATEARNARPLR